MAIISPRTFRGTRDFLPSELLARRRILQVIEDAYRRYGFQPLETPAIEYLEILTGKSEENDKLIYEIKRARGDEEESAEAAIALRYDLTVPLARVVAQYAELPRPFKRYQIQPVWRADRPQPRQGRFREFVQCDADIVGTDSLLADAEIIALTYEVLRDLKFVDQHDKPIFGIRVSSRKYLAGFVLELFGDIGFLIPFCRAIDKLEKIGSTGVAQELQRSGINAEKAFTYFERILEARLDPFAPDKRLEEIFVDPLTREGIAEAFAVMRRAEELGVPSEVMQWDHTLARGLDYYTGPIFETILPQYPHIGSLSGGGRYDGLVATFSKENVPATGTTLGLDRIQTALEELNMFAPIPSETDILVAYFDDEGISTNLQIAKRLRKEDFNVEVWYDKAKLQKQLSYANRQDIPFVIIAGPSERQIGVVQVKNLRAHSQVEVKLNELVAYMRNARPQLIDALVAGK